MVRGYVPLDDNAIVETRARDVLSARIPLLGTVSSASQTGAGPARSVVHHPGPLLFDLLAIPVRLLPNGAGVALGVASINIAAVLTVAWCACRALGTAGACVVMVATGLLMWSFGSESLFEVWQPIVTLLPMLVLLVAGWGWATGDDALAIPAVVAASFVVQTHGSYVLLGPAVLALAAACRLANRSESPVQRRPLLVAAGLVVLAWVQPIIDQLFGSGNLGAILSRASSSSADDQHLGVADAVRAAAMVLVRPPWWTRGGVDTALPNGGGFVNDERGRVFEPDWMALPLALGGLALIVAALVLVATLGRRRGDEVLTSGAVIGVGALLVAIATLARLPVDAFGFTAHKARWLWPIGAYLTAFGFVALLRLDVPASPRRATLSLVLVGVVATVATVPTASLLVSPAQYEAGSAGVARDLRDALGALEDRGVVFLDLAGRAFPDPYNDTVAAGMTARGIPFRVEGRYPIGQYGDRRRLDETVGVDATVRVFTGAGTESMPASWDVVVRLFDGERPVVLAVTDGLVRTTDASSG